jgi:uncharacterized protein (DUF2141 family)
MLRSNAIALVISGAATTVFAQQPRDSRPVAESGTARITGVVTSDESPPKHLRRARVTLRGAEINPPRTVIANDNGTFVFAGLPAGRYTLSATKEAYISMSYGAKRPNRSGLIVTLKNGEARRLTIRLPRGGVITGTITDPDGGPIEGILVSALTPQPAWITSERRLVSTGISVSPTDDRGVYRIYGLSSGEYVVAAQARSPGAMGGLRTLSDSEVRQALVEVTQQRTSGGRRVPGFGSEAVAAPGRPDSTAPEPGRQVAFAAVFYPGTTVLANARRVTVAAGDVRSGIDLQMEYVPTARIAGMIVPLEGLPPANILLNQRGAFVERSWSTRASPEGNFAFADIPPGEYTILARTAPARTSGETRAPLFATVDLTVNGEDISGVVLTPQPALTLSGALVFEGTTPVPSAALAVLNAGLGVPLQGTQAVFGTPIAELHGDNRIAIRGIAPGLFRPFTNTGIRSPIGGWWIRSATLDGREIFDAPIEVRQSSDNLVITLSDRASELTGAITDGQGQPATSQYLVAFATNRTSWFAGSRRVAGVLPDAQGRYTIRNLPAGDYFVAATDDIDHNQWFDADTLQHLATRAARITLGDYEKKTHNVVVGGR